MPMMLLPSFAGTNGLKPSISDDESADYLPYERSMVLHITQNLVKNIIKKKMLLTEKINKQNLGSKIWHDYLMEDYD
ncbi:alpha/beta hydrolase protein [Rhizophagus clarus]|uniref:Alpha/beta hydrolase protein n=1 Tax=Rhizophagus clarus TaxID=94130 RepID=A0A8H3M3T7_9GLOM|nr:alpha/beta hydrolase protein [Rhizophagus clarus]